MANGGSKFKYEYWVRKDENFSKPENYSKFIKNDNGNYYFFLSVKVQWIMDQTTPTTTTKHHRQTLTEDNSIYMTRSPFRLSQEVIHILTKELYDLRAPLGDLVPLLDLILSLAAAPAATTTTTARGGGKKKLTIMPLALDVRIVMNVENDEEEEEEDAVAWGTREKNRYVHGEGFCEPADRLSVRGLESCMFGCGDNLCRTGGGEEVCSICFEEYEGGERVARMPCSHPFHQKCIRTWLRTSNICPLCRFALPIMLY